MVYQYELIEFEADEIDVVSFEAEVRQSLIEEVMNSNLRALVEQGAVISFKYYGYDQEEITTININRFTCKIV
ncbi:hypothetical protein GV64_11480 [Endozoicomonas elysicola]|uniref:Uncharacterized protein n=1 Tax=Endozoicomonas elysicola TaxID=305900 RepID=A0A081KAV3_9GAMM|nr:hypothetical protein GV64_11480 [Endozoicomonas elysicola]